MQRPLHSYFSSRFLVAALAISLCDCSGELPAQDRVEKLRVLAVRAEPPEVRPGETTVFDALTVIPPAFPEGGVDGGAPHFSYLWMVCQEAAGAQAPTACGVTALGNGGSDA